jgi:hypothetical protein
MRHSDNSGLCTGQVPIDFKQHLDPRRLLDARGWAHQSVRADRLAVPTPQSFDRPPPLALQRQIPVLADDILAEVALRLA